MYEGHRVTTVVLDSTAGLNAIVTDLLLVDICREWCEFSSQAPVERWRRRQLAVLECFSSLRSLSSACRCPGFGGRECRITTLLQTLRSHDGTKTFTIVISASNGTYKHRKRLKFHILPSCSTAVDNVRSILHFHGFVTKACNEPNINEEILQSQSSFPTLHQQTLHHSFSIPPNNFPAPSTAQWPADTDSQ